MESRATLALSIHRPQSIYPAKRLMECHDTVILEETPDDRLLQMLSGELSIDSHLSLEEDRSCEFKKGV